MSQFGRDASFSFESLNPLWHHGNSPGQNLDRHKMTGMQISPLINDAHAPAANFYQQFAVPQPRKRKPLRHIATDRLSFLLDASILQHRKDRKHFTDLFGVWRKSTSIQVDGGTLSSSQLFDKLRCQQFERDSRPQFMALVSRGNPQ